MKKEKNFSDTDFSEKIEPSDKKALESLSDDEILQGFKDADARVKQQKQPKKKKQLLGAIRPAAQAGHGLLFIGSRILSLSL